MSKTLTHSLQLLTHIKKEYENSKENRDHEPQDPKAYGSIRRANPNPTARHSTIPKEPSAKEEGRLRARF